MDNLLKNIYLKVFSMYGTFFCKSYRFKKKKLFTFLKVLNFFQWHLFINLIDTYIGIFEKKNLFERYINLNF